MPLLALAFVLLLSINSDFADYAALLIGAACLGGLITAIKDP